MKHPVNSKTRLRGGISRFFTRMFNSGDPRGWGDYHIVPESGGTLWVHAHGLDNYGLLDMEFADVPGDLRGAAVDLMLALVRHGKTGQHLEVDGDFAGALSADEPDFLQVGMLRDTNHGDAEHRGLVRVVDRGEPMGSGFPARLFASHLVARAEEVSGAKKREAMCRRALEIFPGEPASADLRVDDSGGGWDMTELQQTSNLAARIGLAEALLDRDKREECLQVLEQHRLLPGLGTPVPARGRGRRQRLPYPVLGRCRYRCDLRAPPAGHGQPARSPGRPWQWRPRRRLRLPPARVRLTRGGG